MNMDMSTALAWAEAGHEYRREKRLAAQEGLLDSAFKGPAKTYYNTTYPMVGEPKMPTLDDIRRYQVAHGYLTEDDAILHAICRYNDKIDTSTKTIHATPNHFKRPGERFAVYTLTSNSFKYSKQDDEEETGIKFYCGPGKDVRTVTKVTEMTVAEAAKKLGYKIVANSTDGAKRRTVFTCAITLLKKELNPLRIGVDADRSDVEDFIGGDEDIVQLTSIILEDDDGNAFIDAVKRANTKFQAQYGPKFAIVNDGSKDTYMAMLKAKK